MSYNVEMAMLKQQIPFDCLCILILLEFKFFFFQNVFQMMLIFNENDLTNVQIPSLLQKFENHGGFIIKVYVIGSFYHLVTRPSIRDLSKGGESCFAIGDSSPPFIYLPRPRHNSVLFSRRLEGEFQICSQQCELNKSLVAKD